MSSLYELTGQLMELEQMIDAGEIDDDVLLDTWESIDAVFEDKADGYAKIIANLTGSIDAMKAEVQRLNERIKSYENSIKRLKANLQDAMIATDKQKFKTALFSFSVAANPPKVVIDDENAIPADYWHERTELFVDKAALKDDLKGGVAVSGAHLEQGKSLRIR